MIFTALTPLVTFEFVESKGNARIDSNNNTCDFICEIRGISGKYLVLI
jgi:hypothetical protein